MLKRYIQFMKSSNPNKRKKAMIRMNKVLLEEVDVDLLEYLIRASGYVYQDQENYAEDCSVAIMEYVSQYDLSDFTDVIEEVFPSMSVWARSYCFTILTQVPTKETLSTFLRLLKAYSNTLSIYDFNIDEVAISNESARILFPELLHLTNIPSYSYSIYHYTLQCLRDNVLKSTDIQFHLETLLERTRQLQTVVEEYEELFDGLSIWEDSIYLDLRHTFGLYLDILGYSDKNYQVISLLKDCLGLKDTKLSFFSSLSLLRLGEYVSPSVFEKIAASSELRSYLYEHLRQLDALELFPEEFKVQSLLAESNMVQWLVYPTELGRIPDKIELMDVIKRVDPKVGEIEYYLFRFYSSHPNWKEHGWMAGVSGYYIKSDTPTTDFYRYTFSQFLPWDSKKPEEHLDSVIEMMSQYWTDLNKDKQ